VARPRSEERRDAILEAATRVVASQGLGAPTATIAKEANISNGSLFTYFDTKAELLNALYLKLKGEMGETLLHAVSTHADIRSQMLQIWKNWLQWAVSSPEKRQTLKYLSVSEDITPYSREMAAQLTAGIAGFIERSSKNGPMRNESLVFVGHLINSMAEATIDLVIADPANTERYAATAFEAMWRVIT
jgi:AcrR family transcriptional regulator